MPIFDAVLRYRKVYKNYFRVMFGVLRKRGRIVCILRNGSIKKLGYLDASVLVELVTEYSQNPDTTADLLADHYLYFNGTKVYLNGDPDNGAKIDIFFREEYAFLNVDDKVVVDIGANIGDTAIYFELKGARRIIALEPYNFSFKLALENIKKNQLENLVTVVNCAYGIGEDVLLVNEQNADRTRDLHVSRAEETKAVKIKRVSLWDIIQSYNLQSFVLKMDCEGCEYDLLKEKNEALDRVEAMQIEYHYGYEPLSNYLVNHGFDVTHTESKLWYNRNATNPKMQIGFIYATRKASKI